MKIKQLGNGGGLSSLLEGHVNSSFLIDLYDDHSEYLLFDIGYNIMQRLQEEERDNPDFHISKIKHVVVSHKHDDHCGNLETLIYWNMFRNNVLMNIYVPCKGLMKTVKDTNKILDNYEITKIQSYTNLTKVKAYDRINISDTISIIFTPASHGAKKAVGIRIANPSRSFFISGDTKADPRIELFLNRFFYTDIIFHDYSNWDAPSKNVHACKSDFESIYSPDFQDCITKYHTGSLDFNKDWQ